jgi:hypothetical protein
MKTSTLRCVCAVLARGLLATPAFASAPPSAEASPAPAVAVQVPAPDPAKPNPAPLTDQERFAQREVAAPQLQKFKGGDDGSVYIGIGGGTVAVVLLVVLIVLLVR